MLDQQESEFLTGSEESEKLAAKLSSTNDKVSNKGVVREQQELVAKESKALEEALDKVRKAEYRVCRQQQKLEGGQQALGISFEGRKRVNTRNVSRALRNH